MHSCTHTQTYTHTHTHTRALAQTLMHAYKLYLRHNNVYCHIGSTLKLLQKQPALSQQHCAKFIILCPLCRLHTASIGRPPRALFLQTSTSPPYLFSNNIFPVLQKHQTLASGCGGLCTSVLIDFWKRARET